jgi:hypothetical protein
VPCCGDILFVLPFKNQSAASIGGTWFPHGIHETTWQQL